MRESKIEKYLREQVELYGGTCEKFKSPQRKNVPDRICCWPHPESDEDLAGGEIDFVELKATDEEPNEGQARDHKRRRRMGFRVFVIDTMTGVDIYVRMARKRMVGDAE